MSLLSVLLFWLPALGPLIAGYVGGKKSGSVIKALIAGILPAVIVGAILLTTGLISNFPIIGAIVGGAVTIFVVIHSGVLLIGALIGGALS